MRPVRSAVVIVALAGVSLAACGGGDGGGGGAGAGAAATNRPEALVAEAKRGFARLRSVHLDMRREEQGTSQVGRMSGVVFASGQADLTVEQEGTTYRTVVLGRDVYIKAGVAFWRAGKRGLPKTIARRFAGRWIHETGRPAANVKKEFSDLRPSKLSECLFGATGTLTRLPDARIGGVRAIVFKDGGDKPAAAVGRYALTASSPTLPLRIAQYGERRNSLTPAGTPCGGVGGYDPANTTLTLGRFNATPALRAPRGSVTPEEAAGDLAAPARGQPA